MDFDLTRLNQAIVGLGQWVRDGLARKADAESTASALSALSDQITSVSHATLSGITIELGHSAQANGGRGIDDGSYYQLDFSVGSSSFNDFQYTQNAGVRSRTTRTATWKNFDRERQRANDEMLEALGRVWPQYAFWLMTGKTDSEHGHVSPDERGSGGS